MNIQKNEIEVDGEYILVNNRFACRIKRGRGKVISKAAFVKQLQKVTEKEYYDLYEQGYDPFSIMQILDEGWYNAQWVKYYKKIGKPYTAPCAPRPPVRR